MTEPLPVPLPAYVIVILGCAVRAGGLPSQAMQRRVDQALATAGRLEQVAFVPVGGVGRHGPAEATVMQGLLLARGVADSTILPVPSGTNTIRSLLACLPVLRALGAGSVPAQIHVCTDEYHMLRCRAILRIWGIETRAAACARQRPGRLLSYMRIRDRLGLLKDVCLALLYRATRPVPGTDT